MNVITRELHKDVVKQKVVAKREDKAVGVGAVITARNGEFVKVAPEAQRKCLGEVQHVLAIPEKGVLVVAGEKLEACNVDEKKSSLLGCLSGSPSSLRITLRKPLHGHKKRITDVRLSSDPSRSFVFTSSADNNCLMWDTERFKKRLVLGGDKAGVHKFEVLSISSLLDNPSGLATSGGDRVIKIWDLEENKCVKELRDTSASLKVLSGPENILFSGNKEGYVKIWDLRLGKQVGSVGGQAHSSQISGMKYMPERNQLFTSSFDCLIKRWEDPCAGYSNRSEPLVFRGHKGIVKGIEANSSHLYTCSINCTIRIWNIQTAEIVSTLLLTGWPNCLSLMADDKMALACQDRIVSVWKVRPTVDLTKRAPQHVCITDPNTLKETRANTRTYVVVRGSVDGKAIALRKKAVEADLPNLQSAVLEQIRKEEEDRGVHASSLRSKKNRSTKSSPTLGGTLNVTFEIPADGDDFASPGARAKEWKHRWEAEHAKLIRTQDALKEARLARHRLQTQLNELCPDEEDEPSSPTQLDNLQESPFLPYGEMELDDGSLTLRSSFRQAVHTE